MPGSRGGPTYTVRAVKVSDATLQKLSFDRVRTALAERAATRLGAERALAVTPSLPPDVLDELLDRVDEVVTGGDLSLGGIEDVRPFLARVREGNLLEGREILSVAYTLDAAATLRRSIVAGERPALSRLAARIGSFDGALRLVREQLDPEGNVRDEATPKLADIRRRLHPLRGRIRERLTRLLETHAGSVQDPIITLRRDRYVIPIRASAQSSVPGIAVDRSDSGATVFVEPASVVPLNNELALLEMEERDEVRRILLALGRRLADEPGVDESLAVIAELDLANASGRLARDWRLARPEIDDGGRVVLQEARHPLIEGCVPNSLELSGEQRLLVVTGPNAGGKTVLLKTLGLAAVMASSGLFVAAGVPREDGAEERLAPPRLPRVDALLSDIGDEQSIEASLSTYAGHLHNLKAIVEQADERTLVLIDELGSGTDPDEGAALSQAILEAVLERGARGLVTTHLAPLKVFASETEGVRNAAMRFDVDRLQPTYQLVVGQPGRSYALSIAGRLGLGEGLLARASTLLGPAGERLETLLETLEAQRGELQRELGEARGAGEQARREADVLRAEIDRLREREETLLAEAAERADSMLQETLQQAARLKRTATTEPEQRSRALEEIQQLRRQARSRAEARAPKPSSDALKPGAQVRVASYNAEGPVLEVRGDTLLVQLGLLKVEVPRRDVTPAAPPPGRGGAGSAGAGTTGATGGVPAGAGAPAGARFDAELNIRGERVEPGLEKVRDFVAEAHALKVGSVRILHGKGTGALRDAVRTYLRSDKRVERFEDAVPYEGGHGVTVAYLRV
jgi:DNA mismatch repair protein MutS2